MDAEIPIWYGAIDREGMDAEIPIWYGAKDREGMDAEIPIWHGAKTSGSHGWRNPDNAGANLSGCGKNRRAAPLSQGRRNPGAAGSKPSGLSSLPSQSTLSAQPCYVPQHASPSSICIGRIPAPLLSRSNIPAGGASASAQFHASKPIRTDLIATDAFARSSVR